MPAPSNFVFQTMFSRSDHVVAAGVASASPCPVGPRNCGQSPAIADAASTLPSTHPPTRRPSISG